MILVTSPGVQVAVLVGPYVALMMLMVPGNSSHVMRIPQDEEMVKVVT